MTVIIVGAIVVYVSVGIDTLGKDAWLEVRLC